MLRTTYTKKLSQKDEVVLQTNHNFFVRTAIATIVKIVLAGIIMAGAIFTISLLGTATKADTGTLTFMFILSYIAYLVYFIVNVAQLVTLYNRSNEIESSLMGDKIIYKSNYVEPVKTHHTDYDDEI